MPPWHTFAIIVGLVVLMICGFTGLYYLNRRVQPIAKPVAEPVAEPFHAGDGRPPTPMSASYGIEYTGNEPAYELDLSMKISADPVVYTRNLLVQQQDERKYLVGHLAQKVKDLQALVDRAKFLRDYAIGLQVPMAIILAGSILIPGVSVAAVEENVMLGVQTGKTADNYNKINVDLAKAKVHLKLVKDMITMSNEAELVGRDFLPYKDPGMKEEKKKCFST